MQRLSSLALTPTTSTREYVVPRGAPDAQVDEELEFPAHPALPARTSKASAGHHGESAGYLPVVERRVRAYMGACFRG
jgi:hypothetical protein